MKVLQRTHGSVAVVTPVGRIDSTTSSSLEEVTRGIVDSGARDVLVDLSDTDYISSAGLRVFLVLAKRLRDLRGRLVLAALGEPVRQVFQLAGFLPLFTIDATLDAALARFDTTASTGAGARGPAV